MADITKCTGKGCMLRDDCYRFTAEGGDRQSTFLRPPFTEYEGIFDCTMFWGDQNEQVMDTLESIFEGDYE